MNNHLDYETFVRDNREYLEGFKDKRVIVTYGGGKDASVILHYFLQAQKEFGFSFETHAMIYPKHVYTAVEQDKLDNYWKDRGVPIIWHTIDEDESAFEAAMKNGTNPCEACHAIKRKHSLKYLERTVTDWNKLAIVIGWSLWDIVGYTLEYIFGSVYTDREALYQGQSIKERFFRTAQRFYPMLKMKEGYTMYKPLLRYNDQDIKRVVAESGIPLLTTDCKYKDFRPKRQFAEIYIKMDLYFSYDKVMDFAQKALSLENPSAYVVMDKKDFIAAIF